IRMVVSDPQKAYDSLTGDGFLCRLTDVIGVEVADEVGNLNHLLKDLEQSNISVDYLYLSFNRESGKPIMVFHCLDIGEVKACLMAKGYTVL
ncbi:MAG: amino acid-binding protein, partial [Lachnospiraceae bacterium]|nr:amino acid-binding protein [Lachnospiraceae bacterium]